MNERERGGGVTQILDVKIRKNILKICATTRNFALLLDTFFSVVDPEPVGSKAFCRIQIRNEFVVKLL
jgi:hypothetical protein